MMDWTNLLNEKRIRLSSRTDKEHRDEFERDYGRALYSTPVRRLRDKAQVFPLEPNDSVRTRLAHSLEVSSVARGLATTAAKWLTEENQLAPELQPRLASIAATTGLI